MAGTADNYTVAAIPMGTIARLYAGVAVPGAGARMTLDAATGTPDSTANPDAVHLGYTDSGVTVTASETTTDFFADELASPIGGGIESSTISISGTLLQVNDEEVMQVLMGNVGTYSTNTGYKQITMGVKSAIVKSSFAIVYPSPQDPTKFAVWHLYSASNTAGVTFSIGRKTRAGTPFTITGYPTSGRASADSIGNFWWQI